MPHIHLRPVPVAAFLPFNPQVFVAANSNAVLRLVHVGNGMVLQKLKAQNDIEMNLSQSHFEFIWIHLNLKSN